MEAGTGQMLRHVCPRGLATGRHRSMGQFAAAAGRCPRVPVAGVLRPAHQPCRTAAPAVRDRVHRRISLAPGPGNPPRDGSQTDRQNPRADYRRIIPLPPRSLREARPGSRSCVAPRSWHRDSSSARPIRRRPAVRASATAPAAPVATIARPARSTRPR